MGFSYYLFKLEQKCLKNSIKCMGDKRALGVLANLKGYDP